MEGSNGNAQTASDMSNGAQEKKAVQPIDISEEKRQAQEAGKARPAPRDAEKSKEENAGNEKADNSNNPPGGYDSTPIPYQPGGYTVKITSTVRQICPWRI